MMIKKNGKKLIAILMVIALELSLVACSGGDKKGSDVSNPTTIAGTSGAVSANPSVEATNPDIQEDKDLSKNVQKESEVKGGKVYIQGDSVIGTLVIKDDISDGDAKKLAEKYAKELREKYKDLKVNVQAVKGNKNVANVVLDK